jgi:hypothetical protein
LELDYFARFTTADPKAIKLPEPPVDPVEELGPPLNSLKCKTCDYITINTNAIRMHCKKDHLQTWKGDKSALHESVKIQTFFSGGGLQKYFIVNLDDGENGEKIDQTRLFNSNLETIKKCEKRLKTICK